MMIVVVAADGGFDAANDAFVRSTKCPR